MEPLDSRLLCSATPNVTISGVVFDDPNVNAIQDWTEKTGLSSRIFIDANRDGRCELTETSVLSNHKSGNFTLTTNLAPGAYAILQIPPAGYRQTYGGGAFVLNPGDSFTVNLRFACTTRVLIGGSAFNDLNADKSWARSERELRGWRVFIDANNDGKFEPNETSALTKSGGSFEFSTLPPGKYILRIVPQSGWHHTTATRYTLNLTSGQKAIRLLFGQKQ